LIKEDERLLANLQKKVWDLGTPLEQRRSREIYSQLTVSGEEYFEICVPNCECDELFGDSQTDKNSQRLCE
jgi:hypothetical protein